MELPSPYSSVTVRVTSHVTVTLTPTCAERASARIGRSEAAFFRSAGVAIPSPWLHAGRLSRQPQAECTAAQRTEGGGVRKRAGAARAGVWGWPRTMGTLVKAPPVVHSTTSPVAVALWPLSHPSCGESRVGGHRAAAVKHDWRPCDVWRMDLSMPPLATLHAQLASPSHHHSPPTPCRRAR